MNKKDAKSIRDSAVLLLMKKRKLLSGREQDDWMEELGYFGGTEKDYKGAINKVNELADVLNNTLEAANLSISESKNPGNPDVLTDMWWYGPSLRE